MKWPSVCLKDLSLRGPEYGAGASAIPATGARPRYIRITDITSDGRLRPQDCVEAKDNKDDGYALREGDLLLARSGNTVGKSYLYDPLDGPCTYAGYLIRFAINSDVCIPKYAFYFTQTHGYLNWVESKKRVAGQPNINGKEYATLLLPLPPRSEQRKIVELLDQADALRKRRADADRKAECILPALFYKMFGDPATNPMGWAAGLLRDSGSTVRYGLGQPPPSIGKGVPLIRATNVNRGSISNTNMVYVDASSVPASRNAFLKASEVLVVRSGAYTGDVAQVTSKWEGSVAGYDMVITPGKGCTGEFIEAYLLSEFIQAGYFGNMKSRAGQPHLNTAQLESTPFFNPPDDLQDLFARRVNKYRQLRDQRRLADERLVALFDVMLHRAFSGDLTAKWRAAHMKELLREMEIQARELGLEEQQA